MAIVWDDEQTPSAPTGIVWDDERTPSAPSTGLVWDHQPSTTPRSPGASFHDTLTTAWPIVSQVAEGFGIPRAIGNALFPPPPTPPVEYTRNASGRMIPVIPSQRVSALDVAQEFPSALLSEAVSGFTPANLALGYVGGKAAQFLARTPLGQLRIPGLDRFTSPTILDPLTRPRGGFQEPPIQEAQVVESPRQLTWQAPAEATTPNLFDDIVPTPPAGESLRALTVPKRMGYPESVPPISMKEPPLFRQMIPKKIPSRFVPLVEEIRSVGHDVHPDGTITLYHATTKDQAAQILKEGILRRPPDAPDSYGIYLSTSPSVAQSYGDGTVIQVRVPLKDIHPDDMFPGRRMDFNIPTRQGFYKPLTVQPLAPQTPPASSVLIRTPSVASPLLQPFQRTIDAYNAKFGENTFAALSPKAQLEVISIAPESAPITDLIKKVTGQVKTGTPVDEAVALRRLFQREAAVARQAFAKGKQVGAIEATAPIPLTPKQQIMSTTGIATPQRMVTQAQALIGSLRRQTQTARLASSSTKADLLNRLSQYFSDPRQFLRVAQAKFLTPTQVGRVARLYRVQPSAMITPSSGKPIETPLTQEDLRRITSATKKLRPPPGQPTGTPPKIPTSTALIPANVPRPVRDLNQFQSTSFSGLDSSRAAQLIDGTPKGPTTTMLAQLRKGELAAGQETQQIIRQLIQVSHGMKAGSPESQQVFQMLEGRLPVEGKVPTPRAAQTAEFMKRQFDAMLNEVNQARQSIGKRPIIRREGYITHLFDPKVWEDIKGAFTNAPDDATITLADKFREFLRANTPGFRFGLPRTGGPFEEDAINAFKAYVPVAMRVKHLSSASRLASVYLDRSLAGTPNAHAYFSQLVRQVATGEKGPIAKLTPESMLRASNWLKSRFAKGMVLGNLSSVLQQVYTLPATVSATSPKSAAMAAAWISRGDGLSFAEQWSDIVKGRLLESDVDVRGIGSKIERVLGTPFAAADRAMVSHAFLSGYVEAVAQGADFQTAIQRGEHVALRTQSSFLTTDLSPVFRDSITSGFLQFQNTINSVFNFMKFDLDVLNTRPGESAIRNKWIAAGGLVGTFLALAAIFDALGLPRPNQLSEFVPGMSTLRTGGGPVAIRLMMSVSDLGSSDPQKRSQAIKALNTTAFAMGFGAGGNQLRKTLSGVSTVAQGGKLSKTGRLQFPVQGPAEAARAMTFGPYGTKTGQAYIQRGFKPEPLTPEQQLINRRLSAIRRRIRGR